MARREAGFLLIGFGTGLLIGVAAMISEISVWSHHMFIMGFSWRPASTLLALPLLLPLSGFVLVRNKES